MTLYLLLRSIHSNMSRSAKLIIFGGILALASVAVHLNHEHEERR